MGETDRKPVLTGGCQCGAVRYALYAAPEGTHSCHCRMCQKAVGNVFAALAPVRSSDFAWTRGRPAMFLSSTVAERGYCAECGTPLSFGYRDSAWIDVTIGSLGTPERAPPSRYYGTEAAVPWLHLADDWPRSTTEADLTVERQASFRSHQHPDREATGRQSAVLATEPLPDGCG